jgi:hypothetical protein
MSWHLTPGELTLLAPLVGAPVGALITVLVQRFTNKENLALTKANNEANLQAARENNLATLEHQRLIAIRNNLYEKRLDLYSEFAVQSEVLVSVFERGADEEDGDFTKILASFQTWYGRTFKAFNEMQLIASTPPRKAYRVFHDSVLAVKKYCESAQYDFAESGGTGEPEEVSFEYGAFLKHRRQGYIELVKKSSDARASVVVEMTRDMQGILED